MNNNIHLSNFKLFYKNDYNLNNITLLTGSNGTGKSSFIQAILLIRLGIEKNSHLRNDKYTLKNWGDNQIPLNNEYCLSLGTVYDIFNNNEDNENIIDVKVDTTHFKLQLPNDEFEDAAISIKCLHEGDTENLDFLLKKEFYYLNTERLGPRLILENNSTEYINCGYRGEYTAKVLETYSISQKININRSFDGTENDTLKVQVDKWLSYICPGTQVSVESIGTMFSQIKLRNENVSKSILATNIGFGISYVLPIIVTGLIAKEKTCIIVENPEAHLHPKGQSNIGYFLGKIAASGVKVIIETHSEHIVNGIIRASLTGEKTTTDAISIYFFDYKDKGGNHQEITVDQQGNLSNFPKDFFDQVNQDLSAINQSIKSK